MQQVLDGARETVWPRRDPDFRLGVYMALLALGTVTALLLPGWWAVVAIVPTLAAGLYDGAHRDG